MRCELKRLEVDCYQWTKDGKHPAWFTDGSMSWRCVPDERSFGFLLVIDTPRGKETHPEGTWIVRMDDGRIFTMAPHAFQMFFQGVDKAAVVSGRTLGSTSEQDTRATGTEVMGEVGDWKLVTKAFNQNEGWMRSTKAMEVEGLGVLVQVSTLEKRSSGEALTFVPGARLVLRSENPKLYKIVR